MDNRKIAAGFSLVEIMVGMTIGLITVLVVSQVMQVAEARRQTSTSGADAVVNASLALYTIERDGKNAGYGMTTIRGSIGCPIRAQNAGVNRDFNLTPVTIVNGASGAPDTLQFLASDKNGVTLPTRIAVDHPNTAANIFVESDLGVADGDMMIAVPSVLSPASPPTTWCSVFQATGTGGGGGGNGNGNGGGQGQNQVIHNSGQSSWNQSGGSTIFPSAGYSAGDSVINLGNLIDHTYQVFSPTGSPGKSFLRLTEFNMAANSTANVDMYPNIVQLQAVYGKDTNSDNIADAWNATAPTTPAEWQQIRAIRIALVARSQNREPGVVTLDGAVTASTCDSATPHPAALCWRPDPAGNGVKIDINIGNVAPNWQYYRYRVMETTIPLRNAIWRQ